MTESEAQWFLENMPQDGLTLNEIDALDMAYDALKTQIPQKPYLHHDETYIHINNGDKPHEFKSLESDNWHCPSCAAVVGERVIIKRLNRYHDQKKMNFCPRCGQRQDWSERHEG